MKLYLQMGHGMKALTMELIEDWQDGGAILSPRDLKPSQLYEVSDSVRSAGGEALLDPQCYEHDSDHPDLAGHTYYRTFLDNTTASVKENTIDKVLEELAKLAEYLKVRRHILPARIAEAVTEDWFDFQETAITSAQKVFGTDPLLPTIALSYDAACDEHQIGTDRYYTKTENSTSRRATWYYCSQAYSEYKIPFLDMAKRGGVIDVIQPSDDRMLLYSAALFTGAMPTSVNWKEKMAFCHYLSCLRIQAESASAATYQETLSRYSASLDAAETLATNLARKGAIAGDRGVHKFIDANRAGIAVFDAARGARLSRMWASL